MSALEARGVADPCPNHAYRRRDTCPCGGLRRDPIAALALPPTAHSIRVKTRRTLNPTLWASIVIVALSLIVALVVAVWPHIAAAVTGFEPQQLPTLGGAR